MARMRDLDGLERRLGVAFRNKDLLRLALVHSSFPNENPGVFAESNERLEFLGDAVIGLAIAEHLFSRNPGWSEGELTQARSSLVSGETLAGVARGMDLGSHLYMGSGADQGGTRERRSTLAAGLEAVVGALFMDQGYAPARDFVTGTVLRADGPLSRRGRAAECQVGPTGSRSVAGQSHALIPHRAVRWRGPRAGLHRRGRSRRRGPGTGNGDAQGRRRT